MTGIMLLGIISGFTGLVTFSSLNLVKAFLLTSIGFRVDCWRGLFMKILSQNILSGSLLNLIFKRSCLQLSKYPVRARHCVCDSQNLWSW